jgi:hypothetical protein
MFCVLNIVSSAIVSRDAVEILVDTSTVVSQDLALLTEMLGMNLGLVRHIQAIRLLQGTLLVWIDIDVAFDALLAHVGPRITTHPLALTLLALVFAKAPLLALVGCKAFAPWPRIFVSYLRAVLDEMTLIEA